MEKSYRKRGLIDIWELDSLEPTVLKDIVREAIEKHLNLEQLREDLEPKDKDREILQCIVHNQSWDKSENIGENTSMSECVYVYVASLYSPQTSIIAFWESF